MGGAVLSTDEKLKERVAILFSRVLRSLLQFGLLPTRRLHQYPGVSFQGKGAKNASFGLLFPEKCSNFSLSRAKGHVSRQRTGDLGSFSLLVGLLVGPY